MESVSEVVDDIDTYLVWGPSFADLNSDVTVTWWSDIMLTKHATS
jgi:hypothetical protein